ncbi:SDR family NAD(P)-dependent oxidoreductase [Pelagicoccus albus]|uniref:SDR family oxidoreductase n=1 Tax=Pelagicoccus albus TaxID=415222 RepID=A0A7X1E8D7_9BACT|nr:SDR family oxidoreductase [Pelagicoccus albus]MBC2606695.1 SDR family oxidoreductase [Pelagicoccus albus]
MNLGISDKTALVTGSTQGIGFAIAAALKSEGATVYVNGRSEGRVNDAIGRLNTSISTGKALPAVADLSDVDQIQKLFQSIPSVDILVNNTSIFDPKDFFEIADADWQQFFDVNVMSGVRMARHYLRGMLDRNWGRVIFISSESAINIPEEMIHYGMSKTAQLAVSRGLAELTKGTNVTVNSVLPGPTYSEGVAGFVESLASQSGKTTDEVSEQFFKEMRPTSLLQRFADVEEVANMVAYVSSERSSATNGAALRVDGGVVKSAF